MVNRPAQPAARSLRKIQFLSALPDEFLDRLAPIAQTVSVTAGKVLFRQGDAAKSLYLVLEGTVALEICAPAVGCKRILTVESGELLGWSPALGQPRMSATARALTDVLALEVDSAGCLAICDSEPLFGYEFMQRTALAIAKRLDATRLQLLDVYGSELPHVPDERAAP